MAVHKAPSPRSAHAGSFVQGVQWEAGNGGIPISAGGVSPPVIIISGVGDVPQVIAQFPPQHIEPSADIAQSTSVLQVLLCCGSTQLNRKGPSNSHSRPASHISSMFSTSSPHSLAEQLLVSARQVRPVPGHAPIPSHSSFTQEPSMQISPRSHIRSSRQATSSSSQAEKDTVTRSRLKSATQE